MTVISCEKLDKSQAALTIQVSAQEFESAVEKAYQKLRRKFNVPGFRPGKAPRKMMERMYGQGVFYEEAVNTAFPEAYEAAVAQEKLRVVGYPEVEMVGEVGAEGFTFKAVAPVYPEVKLGAYRGLKAEKTEVKVTAADVDERLRQLAQRNTRLVSVTRKAKKGDTAIIDFEGFDAGVPFDGGKGEGHSLELGSGSFVPGFEEQVIGMKPGEEKEIPITFPADYQADLAGKDVVFRVRLQEVKEKDVPVMDDEFAKDVSEFDTLKELKADLKAQITKERTAAADRAFEESLMNQVAEGITADVPDVMVENQARQYVENFKAQISRQVPYEQYRKITGMDEEKLLSDAREPALRQVRMDLAVAAIIEAENIEATDADVEAEYGRLSEQFGMDAETVKTYVSPEQVRDQVRTGKAIAVVVDSARAAAPKKSGTAEKAGGEKPSGKAAGEKPVKKAASAKTAAASKEKTGKKTAKSAGKEPAGGEEKEKKPAAKKKAR